MKFYFKLTGIAIVCALLIVQGSAGQEAAPTAEDIQALRKKIQELETKVKSLEERKAAEEPPLDSKARQRIEELEQKVKLLEHNQQQEDEATAARAKEVPKISLGAEGFSFGSADGRFLIQLRGILQVDSRTFFDDGGIVGNDGLLLRRVRPTLQGTVFRDFDFLFVPDFAAPGSPQIFDVYLNYRYSPELQLRAGKFKVPVGLELLQSDPFTFFNERALPTALTPNRDVGFQLHGELWGGKVSYAAGMFNGVGDGRNSNNVDFEDDKQFAGRVFFMPFKESSLDFLHGLGIGLGGSYESLQRSNLSGLPATVGGLLPGYNTDGQQQFFAYNPTNGVVVADGQHWRLAPQGTFFHGPFGFLSEYVISNQKVSRAGAAPLSSARLEHTGWQISGSWFLTGEDASYNGPVVPRKPFNPAQWDWGAWQLVARYAQLDIDEDAFPFFSNPNSSARGAAAWSVGFNWWLNRNVRVAGSFSHTTFDGGGGAGPLPPAAVTRNDENVVFTRVQLSF
jgi:phosphate-selective porin OprO/OprP